MSEEIEKLLMYRIDELEKKLNKFEMLENKEGTIPTFSFSKIRDKELEKLFDIEKKIDKNIFNEWFNNKKIIESETIKFLNTLILENELLIRDYNEEDLKIKFITPLLNKIKFVSFENEFRDFYELSLKYQTEDFIFQGTTDFVVSKGLVKSKKPYFFIQEFKRSEEFSNPRPQLVAELIAGIELNNEKVMKGAYIVGENWNFVILEKLGDKNYQYFVSSTFKATNREDLYLIYKNLLFIKEEIIQKIQEEKNKQKV